MVWHGDSLKKPSGARKRKHASKRKHEYGREPSETKIDERRARKIRTRGANSKLRLLQEKTVNIQDPKTNKSSKAEVTDVLENKANPHFVRRNIITKGAIIETSAGKARVTNRPGQEGTVNAVKIAEK